MGIQRGSFEGVSLNSQVERAVEHSTIRPDEGTPLRTGAKALDSWADAFGKMADLATKMRANGAAKRGIQDSCKSAMESATEEYRAYKEQPKETQDAETLRHLKENSEQTAARFRASQTLGVFSNDFDMNKDWVAWEQNEAKKAEAKQNSKGWFSW